MMVRVGCRTDVGRTRHDNQDDLLAESPLFLVADGMGGNRGGGTAASLAVEVMGGLVPRLRSGDDPRALLSEGAEHAHRRILEEAAANPDLEGMGTTLTAVTPFGEGRMAIVHVGDSRCYRLRSNVLEQVTEDHSYVNELVRMHEISPEEARVHPHRSLITKALGAGQPDELDPDVLETDAREGDRFLLCSDGLYTMLEDSEISEVLRRHADPQEAADRLVDTANERYSSDNVTVVVLAVEGGSEPVQIDVPATVEREATPEAEQVGTDKGRDSGTKRSQSVGEGGRRRHRVRNMLIATTGAAVVAITAFVGVRLLVLRGWYVGCNESGNLSVYRGVPHDVLGFSVSRVEEVPSPPVRCDDLDRPPRRGVAVPGKSAALATISAYRCEAERTPCPGG